MLNHDVVGLILEVLITIGVWLEIYLTIKYHREIKKNESDSQKD